jgi:hypothetical protein
MELRGLLQILASKSSMTTCRKAARILVENPKFGFSF